MITPHRPKFRDPLPPLNWAVTAPANGRLFYTSQVPLYPSGEMESGAIEDQTRQTLRNLDECVRLAGGDLTNITQVLVYLTRAEDGPGMNTVYAEMMPQPYPNRATIIVAGLLVPGARIEIVAHGVILDPSSA